jgi:PAS domain S-box-containing protein
VPGPIFYKDKSNNYIQINKAIAVANGKTKDEIVGKNLAELYSKEVAEKYYQDDLEVLHSGIPKLNIEEPWETKEGLKWLTTSKIPFVNAEGNIIGVIGMSMDITQRKQLEMEREQFLKFFQISTDIMVIADTNGFFKKINSACLQMLGYTEKELLAKQFIDFVHPDDRPTTLNELANQIKTGHSINFENRYICKDGTTKVLSWQAAYNANDKLTYATARDITERKLAEVQILDLNKELAKKVQVQSIQNEMVNKELDSFTFSVSHDMRAPLRAINSYAQIITEEHSKQLNADGMQMLENIKYNGIKMGRLIDDLLAFSRLGRKELLKSPVNMHELTKLVVKDLNIALPNHATIQVGKLPEVMGDYNLLYQAMYHLVSNAIKYAGKKQNPLIEITATQKEGKDIISIKDNGAGFDMRFSKKLFGVFQRLHSESEFEGNGIGLALVHRIITKHGGTVWGEGKVNEGATFYFTLN